MNINYYLLYHNNTYKVNKMQSNVKFITFFNFPLHQFKASYASIADSDNILLLSNNSIIEKSLSKFNLELINPLLFLLTSIFHKLYIQ